MTTAWIAKNRTTLIVTVVVLVAAYVFYYAKNGIAPSMYTSAWGYAIPLVLAALVGVIGERSGVVNIGIEGQMLVAAFAGFFAAAYSGSLLVGVLAGIGSGLILGGFLAWTTVKWRMDQIIAGVVLNIIATGITSFYYKPGKQLPGLMPSFDVPILSKIPLFGPVFFTGTSIFAILAILAALFVHFGLFHTRWGLRTRSVGEYPSAADTAGINVQRLRLVNVTLAGALAGCAGVYLSMDASSSFERDMVAGRGFLALAIMIMGAWRPLRAFVMAIFFGFINAVASQLQQSGNIDVPPQLTGTLPFVVTIIVLAVAAGRVQGAGSRRTAVHQGRRVMPEVPEYDPTPVAADTAPEHLEAIATTDAVLELPPEKSGFGEGNVGEVLLDIVGLSKSFGSVKANRDISMHVRRGEIVALLGENGAGKSTLVNQIFGLITPDRAR